MPGPGWSSALEDVTAGGVARSTEGGVADGPVSLAESLQPATARITGTATASLRKARIVPDEPLGSLTSWLLSAG